MKRPQRMPFLLDMACLVVVGVNLPFAVYGYLLFGSNTQGMWVGVSECVGACVCVIGYFLSLPHSDLAILHFPPFPRLPSSLPSFPSFLSLGYVFENLPGGWFNDTVRLLLSLELTLTFPIVFKPASEVAEEILHNFMTVQ